MTQTHHVVQVLGAAHGRKTLAHWNTGSASRLIVFVHGFGGKPDTTWPDFPTLLRQKAGPPPFDYVFFGYDGLRKQATNSGKQFLGFLDHFLGDPAALVNATIPSLEKRKSFTYDRVVIAAHSLGAVVTRRALLDAHALHAAGKLMPWLPTVRLVFFAPAHTGAYAAGLVTEALTDQPWYLAKLAGYYARFQSPLLADLKEGSQVLRALADDTAKITDHVMPPPHYVRARVLLAGDEIVVNNTRFGVDPVVPPQDVLPSSHTGVCKPRRIDHAALRAVWNEL